ncbi:MAG: hypothetical protein WCE30_14210, partial [Mycobacterium sp.]
AAQRHGWTAAALAVLGSGGDRAAAGEVVDLQIKPFVDSVVCGELARTLQSASNDVANSYDSALSAVRPGVVGFEVPGEFGGGVWRSFGSRPSEPVARVPASGNAATFGGIPSAAVPMIGNAAAPAVPTALAAPSTVPAAAPIDVGTAPAVAPVPPAVAPPAPEPALPMSASSGLPGDLGIGSAVGGFGKQLADILGGALGSAAGLVPDGAALGDLTGGPGEGVDAADDPGTDPDDDGESETSDGEAEGDAKVGDPATEDAAIEGGSPESKPAVPAAPPESQTPASTPPPNPVPADAPVGATPPAEPVAVQERPIDKTPCQIAADELPQVGE